jgi:hypothetical protein
MALSITEQLCHSTVRIVCKNDKGKTSTGSGFFFDFKNIENETVPVIITNKHVVKDMTTGYCTITTKDAKGNPKNTAHCDVEFPNLQAFIKEHPEKDVDLCAIMIGPILIESAKKGIGLFYKCLNMSFLPTVKQLEELSPLEDILMIGYPKGLWDHVNNMPILRRGITATNPCLDYRGKKEFMIDAACFPGSSGSPVLIVNLSSYTTKSGAMFTGKPRVILLGVLYAAPRYKVTGEIEVVDVPTKRKVVPGINLGIVIRYERIIELGELFKNHIYKSKSAE